MDALAAIDIAVWDALGKRNHLPVAALLDSQPRTNIPVYLSGLRRATLDERVIQAKSLADQGVRGAKIFQSGDIKAALQELDALIHGAPDVEQWMVDTLWMCTLDDAIHAKREFGDPKSQPPLLRVPAPTRRPRRTSHTAPQDGSPIAIGEHFRTTYQLNDWLTPEPVFDVYQPDIGRTSISDFIRQRNLATSANVPTTPHMGNGVSVFQAATLQCAAVSSPELLQEFQGGLSNLLQEASDTGWQLNRRRISIARSPRSRRVDRRKRHRTIHRTSLKSARQPRTLHAQAAIQVRAYCNL